MVAGHREQLGSHTTQLDSVAYSKKQPIRKPQSRPAVMWGSYKSDVLFFISSLTGFLQSLQSGRTAIIHDALRV